MSRHNVRLKTKYPHGLIKTVQKCKVDDRVAKLHMFTKIVMETGLERKIH